jgi:hypothetical protein
MSWGAQNRSKDAKTPSVAGGRSRKPKPALCGIQPYWQFVSSYWQFAANYLHSELLVVHRELPTQEKGSAKATSGAHGMAGMAAQAN